MKNKSYLLFVLFALSLVGCHREEKEDQVLSQRYIHKYGYAVSKEEWETKHYPGQVITTLRDGVTITATYENGILHGATTNTYPHSQTVESYYLYNQGNLVKEIYYDVRGMPIREEVYLSPSRISTTLWYQEGTPLSIEERMGEEILEGQYFSANNEVEARIEKGNGKRIVRNSKGVLISKDLIENGYMTQREAFYATGSPESVTHYAKGDLHGEKRTYALTGEPLAIEEWVHGHLHGKSTYFKNGTKYLEVSYINGLKEGREVHYIDGNIVSQEIRWENDRKHGPATFFIDGIANVQWYYDGEKVSQRKFEELNGLDEMITHISQDVRIN